MGEKAPEQLNDIITNSITALVVRRIEDDLIDTLDSQIRLEIAISDINIAIVLSESETKSKQKNQEKQGPVSLLICYQMDTQYKNFKYPI